MPRSRVRRPTDRELAILQVLWESGPSTVRQVQDKLNEREAKQIAYTSVLTILQIMVDKGLVTRDESSKSHIYTAVKSRSEVEDIYVEDLIERLFRGSAMRLVAKALSPKRLSTSERLRLQKLLHEMEED